MPELFLIDNCFMTHHTQSAFWPPFITGPVNLNLYCGVIQSSLPTSNKTCKLFGSSSAPISLSIPFTSELTGFLIISHLLQ